MGEKAFLEALISRLASYSRDEIVQWFYSEGEGSEIDKIEFVEDGRPVWIGLPWLGYELHSWYEHSRDDDDPDTDPKFDMYLGEVTWDYASPEPKADPEGSEEFLGTWGVDTADLIQVTPKIVVSGECVHPRKTVFGVRYFQEAIQKEILTAWKKAVQELYYLTYDSPEELKGEDEPGEETGSGKSASLQVDAQKRINQFLGLSETDEDGIDPLPTTYSEGSRARMIYDAFGWWLKRVRIRDIDPTDQSIRESLQNLMKARAKAAADIAEAKGARDAEVITTDGKTYKIKQVGKAEAEAFDKMTKAQKERLADLGFEDGMPIIVAEVFENIAGKAKHTYFSGGGNDLMQLIMGAADRIKGKGNGGGKDETKKT